jgi:hypothetical protein
MTAPPTIRVILDPTGHIVEAGDWTQAEARSCRRKWAQAYPERKFAIAAYELRKAPSERVVIRLAGR